MGRVMSKKISRIISTLILAMVIMPVSVMAGSIGDSADNLMGPTSIVMKLVEVGCYLLGLGFVMMSLAQYKIHRQSPKLVPLSTPITLAILGIIALLIPYTTKLAETGKNEVPQDVKQSSLPVPQAVPKGAGLPYPPGHQVQPHHQEQEQEQNSVPMPGQGSAPADSGGTGGGGWTTDPRYNR